MTVSAIEATNFKGVSYKEAVQKWFSEGNNKYIIEFQSEPLLNSQKYTKSSVSANSKIISEHNQFKADILGVKSSVKTASAGSNSNEYKIALNGMAVELTPWQLLKAMRLSYVKKIHPSREYQLVLMDSVGIVRANETWETQDSNSDNITGINSTISIIDTGIDYTHDDLGNCSTAEFLAGTCAKVVGGYDVYNDDADPMDDQGHGTHCAGIAAANGVVKGVAPGAKLYAYKVFGSSGGAMDFDILRAIELSLDPNEDLDTSDRVDVISMSLGGGGDPDDALSTASDNAVDAGVVVVIAAGNDGPDLVTVSSPGTSRKAITVGASCKPSQVGSDIRCRDDDYPSIATFSSRGSAFGYQKPEVSAPGVMICSTQSSQDTFWQMYMDDDGTDIHCIDDEHIAISGTSMATPHVAGAVALLVQAHPDWTPLQIKAALERTSYDFGYNINVQGRGQIDVYGASQLTDTPSSGLITGISNVVYR
ncbi:S8 family serine peptidase [Nanoarchaeota archaeon]